MGKTYIGLGVESKSSPQTCHRFSLTEIQIATNWFDDELVIGHGGFGKVYKGHIFGVGGVAIKRLDSMSSQGATEFRTEIEMLSKLCHRHLVPLVGYCDDNKEMILVYKYVPNGTLYDHLHKTGSPFNWVQRLKIAIGAARGLNNLHTGGIIHRDVKSSNILLDEKWAAVISDFGLSKIGPTNSSTSYVSASVKGTFGYLDPEYFYTGRLTKKTDVYAFGVVLFELLSGRLAVDERFGEDNCSLVRWAEKCTREGRLHQLVDSNIKGTIFPRCLRQYVQTAKSCLDSCLNKRSTMANVVFVLEILLEIQEKCNSSSDLSSIMGITWKKNNYFVSSTHGSSDQIGTSSSKSASGEDNTNQYGAKVAEDLKMFTLLDLSRATRGFMGNRCLGLGINGKVYKGWVDKETYSPSERNTGLAIAIKSLNFYKFESFEKFELDLQVLREFCHPNLLKLIGYCVEGEKLHLVYHFMQNGSLKDQLLNGAVARLPLITKLKIVVGIARAIVFLHKKQNKACMCSIQNITDSRLQIHNILLDEDFVAKLSGCDVAKLVKGLYFNGNDLPNGYHYYPCSRPIKRGFNATSFTTLVAKVLTGK